MPKPPISATVANIVITATVDSKLDLSRIVSIPGATVPEHFPAIIYRPPPEHPKGLPIRLTFGRKGEKSEANPCILVFSTGKMVCPGESSVENTTALVHRFMKDLKAHGIAVDQKPVFKISNVVVSGSLGGFVNLEAAATKLRGVVFEPEQFPGLIYRMEDPHAVFLLFTSGKFVCPGIHDDKAVAKLKELHEKMKLLLGTIHEAATKTRELLEEKGLIAYVDP
jgi:transcription initiation factor TFIID TATA-box-binding protein